MRGVKFVFAAGVAQEGETLRVHCQSSQIGMFAIRFGMRMPHCNN